MAAVAVLSDILLGVLVGASGIPILQMGTLKLRETLHKANKGIPGSGALVVGLQSLRPQ